MTEELQNEETTDIAVYKAPGMLVSAEEMKVFNIKLQKFVKLLEKYPDKEKVVSFTDRGKELFKYIPVDVIENNLNRLFFGLWSEELVKDEVVANEMKMAIHLRVFHPIAGIWIQRLGTAAIQIRMKKDSQLSEGINAKIRNALQLDYPHLKSEALKNACLTLGRTFGRGLRRDYLDDYRQLIPDEPAFALTEEQEELITKTTITIGEYEDASQLAKDWGEKEVNKLDLPNEAKKQLIKLVQSKYDSLKKEGK